DRRYGRITLAEQVSPLRLAAWLDLDRGHFEQPHSYLIKSGGVAAREFKLNLADRLACLTTGRADFTLVDCRRDPRFRSRFDGNRCAGDIGRKERSQIIGNPLRQLPPTLRRPRIRVVFEKVILPLAAAEKIAPADVSRLDGLDKPAILLADTQRQA